MSSSTLGRAPGASTALLALLHGSSPGAFTATALPAFCAPALKDQGTPGSCIEASSVPSLGMLFPLGEDFFVDGSGRVGIGTLAPVAPLHVIGDVLTTGKTKVNGPGAQIDLVGASGKTGLSIRGNTNNDLRIMDQEGNTTIRMTGGTGLARMGSIEITGGSDIPERFQASVPGCDPGTLVAVDPEDPCSVRPSTGAYDRRVVGIISGAGGVRPGITLGMDGVLDGDILVAIAGRVHVRCSTENGPIASGDLLVASSVPGVAMRSDDPARAFGAVVGKALGPIDENGLVLALVNLQ